VRRSIEPERPVLRPIFDQAPFSTRPKCYCSVHPFRSITVSVRTQFSYVTGDDPGVRIESPQGKGIFSLLQNFQTVSGAHPASYSMGTGVFSRGVERLGREVDHSHPSSAGVKTGWSYTSTPPISFCGVTRNNLVLYERHPS